MITIEYTDTYGGEANYCWVKRYFTRKPLTDLQAVRLAKKLVGLSGVRCRNENMGDFIALYPQGSCTVLFVAWQADDSPDFGHPAFEGEAKGGV